MLLTISTTHRPATDLGYLLMKNPANVHEKTLPFGRATFFCPEASEERCTAALTLEIDPVAMVRGRDAIDDSYVSDRPYAASSLLSVAMGRLLNTAMSGRSRDRQELADTAIALAATITPLPARGAADIVERLFEPLGYEVSAAPIALDPAHPEWGDSKYVRLLLEGETQLAKLLNHLFVLIPVLDDQKHYFIGEAEVEKLLRKGKGWLEDHPERDLITRRYLRFGGLVRQARAALDESVVAEEAEEHAARDAKETGLEKPIRLNDQRMERVAQVVREAGAKSVLDLGCGEGRLLRELIALKGLDRIVGVEVAPRVLAAAGKRHPDGQPGNYSFESNMGTPLAHWSNALFRVLEPCWRPVDTEG